MVIKNAILLAISVLQEQVWDFLKKLGISFWAFQTWKCLEFALVVGNSVER